MLWIENAAGGRLVDEAAPVWTAADRGAAYGDGLFETVRVESRQALFLDRHLRRLMTGLAVIGLASPWDTAALAVRCRDLCLRLPAADGVLKLTLSRGPGPRGYEPPAVSDPLLVIEVRPGLPPPSGGVGAVLAPWRIEPASPLVRLKSLSALDRVVARRLARQEGAAEALFLNLTGHLTEATASNLFIVQGGRILTPDSSCGLLPGITRELLLEFAPGWGYDLREAELEPSALAAASEAFLTNVVSGIVPLVRFQDRPIGDGRAGPLTAALAAGLADLRRSAAGAGS